MNRTRILADWLRDKDENQLEKLRKYADAVRRENVGDAVHLRGLIEFSSYCVRQCTYCGLRAGNKYIPRYRMTREEILKCVDKAYELGYGTVVLQAGEDDEISAGWLGEIIQTIKINYPLAVTLSVGECSIDNYRLWRNQGADRYLLKFETSDTNLFRRIHPPKGSQLPNRIELLKILQNLGYEIGGGIMVGLPGQTYSSVARDIELFAEFDSDMIGIGPYIPHPNTPLGREFAGMKKPILDQIPNDDLATNKVIALARIMCPEANIPATTALASIHPCGFEEGLRYGANVIMPNLTPIKYRCLYEIYPNSVFQNTVDMHAQIMKIILASGRYPGSGRGDRRQHRYINSLLASCG